MTRNRWKLYTVLMLVVTLVIGMALPAFASLDDARDELDEIRREREQMEAEMEAAQSELERLVNRLERLESDLVSAQQTLVRLNREISEAEDLIARQAKKIEETIKEIEETETYLEEQTEYLEARLQSMYKNGTVSYLEVLFSATSFTDFLSRFGFLRSLIESDVELVEAIEAARDKLEEDKAFLEAELERQEERRDQLAEDRVKAEQEQVRISDMISEQQRLRDAAQAQMSETEEYIRGLEQDEKHMEDLIRRMEEEGRFNEGEAPSQLFWPVVLQDTGSKVYFIISGWRTPSRPNHNGIDIAPPHFNSIGHRNYGGSNPAIAVASASGTILEAGWNNSYGWYAIIDHGGGWWTRYAHLHLKPDYSVGDFIAAGQMVGYIGSTGNSTGPHLHYEVYINGTRVNPEPLLTR